MKEWDDSIVDFAAPLDGFLTRAFGGRSGPIALENGAELTFPFQEQLQVAGSAPGVIQAYADVGAMSVLSLTAPTEGGNRGFIRIRGHDAGTGSVLIETEDDSGSFLVDSTGPLMFGPDGSQIFISSTQMLLQSLTDMNIFATDTISISNNPTTGTTITIDSNAALNLVGVPVNINGVDVSTGLGQWTAYSPTVTQSVSVTRTVTYGRYMKLGRTVIFQCYLAIGSGTSGTANNVIYVSLPVAGVSSANGMPISGTFYVYDDSTAPKNWVGHAILTNSSASISGLLNNDTNYFGGSGSSFAHGLTNLDSVLCSVVYEAAS